MSSGAHIYMVPPPNVPTCFRIFPGLRWLSELNMELLRICHTNDQC